MASKWVFLARQLYVSASEEAGGSGGQRGHSGQGCSGPPCLQCGAGHWSQGQVCAALWLLVNQLKDFSPLCGQGPRAGESRTPPHLAGGQGCQASCPWRALDWGWGGAQSGEGWPQMLQGQRSRWGLASEEAETASESPLSTQWKKILFFGPKAGNGWERSILTEHWTLIVSNPHGSL